LKHRKPQRAIHIGGSEPPFAEKRITQTYLIVFVRAMSQYGRMNTQSSWLQPLRMANMPESLVTVV